MNSPSIRKSIVLFNFTCGFKKKTGDVHFLKMIASSHVTSKNSERNHFFKLQFRKCYHFRGKDMFFELKAKT